jgi:AraC-like DNA-binding protein
VAIAVGGGAVAIVDDAGTCHRGAALVVAPMARHRMLDGTDLLTFFVDPHCAFADRLRERATAADGVAAAPELCGLTAADLRPAGPSRALDPRLIAAMDAVTAPGAAMPDVAARVGLSPQRLRALARRELGLPLLRWRAWVRLGTAAEALRDGRSIADAAITGGFADQAHLTRWMREMMGLTPTVALPALRGQPGPRPDPRRAT